MISTEWLSSSTYIRSLDVVCTDADEAEMTIKIYE